VDLKQYKKIKKENSQVKKLKVKQKCENKKKKQAERQGRPKVK